MYTRRTREDPLQGDSYLAAGTRQVGEHRGPFRLRSFLLTSPRVESAFNVEKKSPRRYRVVVVVLACRHRWYRRGIRAYASPTPTNPAAIMRRWADYYHLAGIRTMVDLFRSLGSVCVLYAGCRGKTWERTCVFSYLRIFYEKYIRRSGELIVLIFFLIGCGIDSRFYRLNSLLPRKVWLSSNLTLSINLNRHVSGDIVKKN